jgi:hypothetical protein
MRRRLAPILFSLALLAVAVPLAACGAEEHSEVVEGQPLELGELRYNVAITRFLNPDDVEDSEYLVGQPPEPPGQSYLGVFMLVSNESDEEAYPSATEFVVTDTTGARYEPIESESPYALDVGATVEADGELPIPDSTAAEGVIEGAMLLFLVDDEVSENRPLELEIGSAAGSGHVELDI